MSNPVLARRPGGLADVRACQGCGCPTGYGELLEVCSSFVYSNPGIATEPKANRDNWRLPCTVWGVHKDWATLMAGILGGRRARRHCVLGCSRAYEMVWLAGGTGGAGAQQGYAGV